MTYMEVKHVLHANLVCELFASLESELIMFVLNRFFTLRCETSFFSRPRYKCGLEYEVVIIQDYISEMLFSLLFRFHIF